MPEDVAVGDTVTAVVKGVSKSGRVLSRNGMRVRVDLDGGAKWLEVKDLKVGGDAAPSEAISLPEQTAVGAQVSFAQEVSGVLIGGGH